MISIVLGRKGQGKSTLALFLARQTRMIRHTHPPVFFDPKNCFKVVPTATLENMSLILRQSIDEVRYVPSSDDKTSLREEFRAFFDALAWEHALGEENPRRILTAPVVLVVDEVSFLQDANSADATLSRIIRLSDRDHFHLILCAHRPREINAQIAAQADRFFLFRQHHPIDLERISDWCGEQVAEQVKTLGEHIVLRYNFGSETWTVLRDPEDWYVETSEVSK